MNYFHKNFARFFNFNFEFCFVTRGVYFPLFSKIVYGIITNFGTFRKSFLRNNQRKFLSLYYILFAKIPRYRNALHKTFFSKPLLTMNEIVTFAFLKYLIQALLLSQDLI